MSEYDKEIVDEQTREEAKTLMRIPGSSFFLAKALARILIVKGVITKQELLDDLMQQKKRMPDFAESIADVIEMLENIK